jgi:uncharacterized protein
MLYFLLNWYCVMFANKIDMYYTYMSLPLMTSDIHRKQDSSDHYIPFDKYTTVLSDPISKMSLNNPFLIAGFPDGGMIGSISVNQIIEELAMHQIASVESQHIMPAAIFIGKRFRHPFRIYANDSGTVCALVCEVPVTAWGTFSIINTIIDWSSKAGTREILVLGGILPTNFSPPFIDRRRPLLLQNEVRGSAENEDETVAELVVPDEAIIVGLAGSLLSMCSARNLKCTALMVPTELSSPDPEGAAIVLEALTKIPFGLKINTSRLRKEAETIRKHLNEFMKMSQHQIGEQERATSDTERIYK